MSEVRWVDGPSPGGPGCPPDVLEPGLAPLKVVLVSASVQGADLHWISGRTVPCIGEEEGCPYHHDRTECGLRWKGYAACLQYGQWSAPQCLVAITKRAWVGCGELRSASRAGLLRGRVLTLTRGRGVTARAVLAELSPFPVAGGDKLPPPIDVKASLLVLWYGIKGQPDVIPFEREVGS